MREAASPQSPDTPEAGKTEPQANPAPIVKDPLDHDGDGKKGGSLPRSQRQPPAAPDGATAFDESAAPRTVYLTTDFSEEYGPKGRFLDLTDAEASSGLMVADKPEDAGEDWEAPPPILVRPTEEQLARRRFA